MNENLITKFKDFFGKKKEVRQPNTPKEQMKAFFRIIEEADKIKKTQILLTFLIDETKPTKASTENDFMDLVERNLIHNTGVDFTLYGQWDIVSFIRKTPKIASLIHTSTNIKNFSQQITNLLREIGIEDLPQFKSAFWSISLQDTLNKGDMPMWLYNWQRFHSDKFQEMLQKWLKTNLRHRLDNLYSLLEEEGIYQNDISYTQKIQVIPTGPETESILRFCGYSPKVEVRIPSPTVAYHHGNKHLNSNFFNKLIDEIWDDQIWNEPHQYQTDRAEPF